MLPSIRLLGASSLLWTAVAFAQPVPPPSVPGGPAPMAAPAPAPVALIVSDTGALAPEEVKAVRSLAVTELRAEHLSVSEDPRLEGTHAADAQTFDVLHADGISRLFVLNVNGRLGHKIPFTMEERDPSGQVVASASLSSNGIEEADTVIPRLTRAVLARQTASQAATMDSVTEQEAKPFNKKYGENLWSLGLALPTYSGSFTGERFGVSIGYHYEAQFWRVGLEGEFAGANGQNSDFLGIEGAWLPLDGEVSPYIGGGFGSGWTQSGNGIGFKVEGGVEMLRLRTVRVLAGMDLFIPAYDDHQRGFYPLVHVAFMF